MLAFVRDWNLVLEWKCLLCIVTVIVIDSSVSFWWFCSRLCFFFLRLLLVRFATQPIQFNRNEEHGEKPIAQKISACELIWASHSQNREMKFENYHFISWILLSFFFFLHSCLLLLSVARLWCASDTGVFILFSIFICRDCFRSVYWQWKLDVHLTVWLWLVWPQL